MSFITESRLAYKKVQEAEDHEISMARGELEAIADKATQLSSMLQGKSDEGNPLEAWVQSKITKAKDYINSVSDYMMYNPKINESYKLEETTFEKIYQMQQDGKTAEDIAKELKLKPDLVKKVLGEEVNFTSQEKEIIKNILENKKEIPKQSDLSTYDSIIKKFINFKKSKSTNEQVELKEFSDAQIAQLKKEYGPLKGKTITTSQYQQLKNILFKLQDGDLEKLQKQNIPFASTGAGSILRVRKSPVKITNVKVPGLEGMAEEKIDLQEKPSIKQYVVFHSDSSPTKHKEFKAYDETELNKQIGEFLKQNPGYKVYGKSPSQSIKETFKDNIIKKIVKPIQDYNKKKEEPKKEVKESHFAVGQHVIYKPRPGTFIGDKSITHLNPRKAQIIQVTEPRVGAYYKIKISPTLMTYAQPDELKLVENKINEGAKALVEAIAALQKKADKSGMPYSILKQVYDRGMAAWKGGHRPGAGQHQWAFARVNSFITKSSGTWGGADSDLAKKVKGGK